MITGKAAHCHRWKATQKEASKLTRKRIKEAGRLIVEEQKDE